ncbi:MAG: 2Fe-2S iron-sulfur cluster binding domain-containing protein [Deltaproteobacteria bacterium]|nr:MAG: 2Fe-2S iron-sulfur cluster binding domain-containing protein [Deltaproteobacteria bacterium]TMQ11369.1 MAG: 2Fe-2S iron-sulfur cluster binding domain-containing protein [Deltaproteobacteria bacterium]
MDGIAVRGGRGAPRRGGLPARAARLVRLRRSRSRGRHRRRAVTPTVDFVLDAPDLPVRPVPLVTIRGTGEPVAVDLPVGATLFEAGARVSAGIDTACVGKGTCGLCRVKIVAGAEHLTPYSDEERKHLGNVYHLTRVRLACRSKLSGGDVTIEVVRRRK